MIEKTVQDIHRTVLVTGAAGLMGLPVVRCLRGHGFRVVAGGRWQRGNAQPLGRVFRRLLPTVARQPKLRKPSSRT